MTLPRRRPDKPIKSVELRLTFRVDRNAAEAIMALVPSAVVRGGVCRLRLTGETPGGVADEARKVLETIRNLGSPSKGFNRAEGPHRKD